MIGLPYSPFGRHATLAWAANWQSENITPRTKLLRAGIYALSKLLLLATTLAYGSSAWSDEAFFQGKRITIFIGTQSGGSIVAARIISQYLGKYIPGNPSISVQPMLGGAHIVATNHVFNIAKPDGLTLLAANPTLPSLNSSKRKRSAST